MLSVLIFSYSLVICVCVCVCVCVYFQRFSVAVMGLSTFLFCLFWQFNQFIMLLQAFALFGVWILDVLPARKVAWRVFIFIPPPPPPPPHPQAGRGCLMSPSCLESQGCHLIPLSYLLSCFFCLVLLLFLSCHFSANGPFSWLFFQKTLKYFSWRVRLFCMALVEQLGDDSW